MKEMLIGSIVIVVIALAVLPTGAFTEEYSLDDLYGIALQRSEKIKVSEENLYIAKLGKEKAFSVLVPKVSAFGNYTKYSEDKSTGFGVIQPDFATVWGMKLEQSFSLSGRELTGLKMAEENIVRNSYDLYAAREEHLFAVASAYYDVLKAKKILDIADSNLERLTKHRNAAEKRLKVGEVTRTALLRAEGELSGARSDQLTVKNGWELARAILARIVVINRDFQLREAPREDMQISSLTSLQEIALAERAEIKSLESQKKIAGQQIQYAKGTYWPELSVSGVYKGADQSPASPFLLKESAYGELSLDFPLFEGGLRRAEVREAKAKERQAGLFYEDLKKTIQIEVESAYLELVTQKGILKFLEDQLVFARDNYYAVSKQFEFGLADSIDVMDANTLLVSAERKVAEAVYNYQLSILRIKRVTGVLLKTVVSHKF